MFYVPAGALTKGKNHSPAEWQKPGTQVNKGICVLSFLIIELAILILAYNIYYHACFLHSRLLKASISSLTFRSSTRA